MAIHSIDEDQILQMIKIFQGYQENFSTTFLQRKSESHIEHLDTTIQDQLREACIYIGDKEAFGKEVVDKALQMFNNVRAAMMMKSERLVHFENKVEDLERQIGRLESSIKVLEEENENSEGNNQVLRKRINELEKGMEEHENSINNDKILIKESMHAYSELEETSIIKHNSLLNQNQKISHAVSQYKEQIHSLKQQIQTLQEDIKELGGKLRESENSSNRLKNQKELLEGRVGELEGVALEYQQQLKEKSLRSTGRKYSDREDFNLGMLSDKDKDKSVVLDMRNLNQEFKETEIIFEQDVFAYTNQLIEKANSQHYLGDFQSKPKEKEKQKEKQKQKQKQQQKQKQRQKKPNNQQTINRMMIDPYYAHFILTSQSVKIRLDHDQFLGIDFQKYYKQVMESGIQMHNWPTWIETKLKELTPAH